jgi:murein DD-endopeptidase MepM/ murein hydrolase activator NlpD
VSRIGLLLFCAVAGVGCTSPSPTSAPVATAALATPTTAPTTRTPTTGAATTTSLAPTTTAAFVPTPTYVFPFTGRNVSYGTRHTGYQAIDVFGCGANVVAPTSGTVTQVRTTDPWEPAVNDPATRGGQYVSMVGDDGVRYYFAHLGTISTAVGTIVAPGDALGIMGQTGDARATECHTHFGISWPCPTVEWQVRRGEILPPKYLDAWRLGQQLSPADEVAATLASNPNACADAANAKGAANA